MDGTFIVKLCSKKPPTELIISFMAIEQVFFYVRKNPLIFKKLVKELYFYGVRFHHGMGKGIKFIIFYLEEET
jgi:hypothetical protein